MSLELGAVAYVHIDQDDNDIHHKVDQCGRSRGSNVEDTSIAYHDPIIATLPA